MKDKYFTIGELAKAMKVTVRTLQYYDKEGLLKPSKHSPGGRRLYTSKDLVRLHQILSFKYLGFSLEEIKNRILPLDSPQEVCAVLQQQEKIIGQQIRTLQEAQQAAKALHDEVAKIDRVDFKKYAEIIELLRMGNTDYWVWKLLDDTLSNHIQQRFGDNPELGTQILADYQVVLEEAISLNRAQEPPDSAKSMALAHRWWTMIMNFTGGDMSLLPKLMAFNDNKEDWDADMARKQQEADPYLEQVLGFYFTENNIQFPEKE